MAHSDAWEGKWRGNWWMEWIASTLHTTLEHGLSSITTADAHTSAASSRLNCCPRRFKWTRLFRWKTKVVFSACAITFQTQSTTFDIVPHLTWDIFDTQTFWKLFLSSGICNKKNCVLGPIDQINFCPWRIFLYTVLFRMTGIYPVQFQVSSAGCFCLYRWVHWSQLPRFRKHEFIALPLIRPHMTLLGGLLHFLSYFEYQHLKGIFSHNLQSVAHSSTLVTM
jgi:hypothetical protein